MRTLQSQLQNAQPRQSKSSASNDASTHAATHNRPARPSLPEFPAPHSHSVSSLWGTRALPPSNSSCHLPPLRDILGHELSLPISDLQPVFRPNMTDPFLRREGITAMPSVQQEPPTTPSHHQLFDGPGDGSAQTPPQPARIRSASAGDRSSANTAKESRHRLSSIRHVL